VVSVTATQHPWLDIAHDEHSFDQERHLARKLRGGKQPSLIPAVSEQYLVDLHR